MEIVTNRRNLADIPSRSLESGFEVEVVDDALYQVASIQPLTDGAVAIGAMGAGAVFVYDRQGALVTTLGRPGDGPGELRSIASVFPVGRDSLGVYDARMRRLTIFPLQGGTPRLLDLATLAPERGGSRVLLLAHGLAFVGEAGFGSAREPGVYRENAASYRLDLEGRVVSAYGEFPGTEMAIGEGLLGRAPFGALLAATTSGSDFIVGTGEEPELKVFGPDGRLTRVVRWDGADRAITEERRARFIDFVLSKGPPEQAAAMRGRMEQLPVASRMPAYAEVLALPDGSLWVGEYAGPEAEFPGRYDFKRAWMVFDETGAITERVQTPEGFRPMALTEGHVWGVYRDEFDVESVRAYVIQTKEGDRGARR